MIEWSVSKLSELEMGGNVLLKLSYVVTVCDENY